MMKKEILNSANNSTVRLDGSANQTIETGRNRLLIAGSLFILAFA